MDVNLQRRKYQANLEAGAAKINEEKEAAKLMRDNAGYIKAIAEKLDKITSGDAMKIDGKNLPATNVTVNAKDFNVTQSDNSTPQNSDTAAFYGASNLYDAAGFNK